MKIEQMDENFNKKCKEFTQLILKYNKTHNITGAKTEKKVLENIEDSIYPLTFLDPKKFKTVIDVGSGAGFPAIILSFAMPNTHFYLFEPIAKKSSFLHLVKSNLNLKNVTIRTCRVEEEKAFSVDLITSRAVTDTKTLIDLCKSFISTQTTLLFYKGQNLTKEIEGLKNYEIYQNSLRNYLVLKEIYPS